MIQRLADAAKKKQHVRVSEFLQRVQKEFREHNLISRRQRILVAVSGGVDSMVLLHLLNLLSAKNRWKLSVAHFNHQLRGRASDADERLVRQIAKTMRLPIFTETSEVDRFAAQSKISIEMAARKLRHEFFARVARAKKISIIALAHHSDDQVELFFVRMLRGTGGVGLAGMKPRSPSPADKKITLVRPLLGFSKAQVLEFAREHRVLFREDTSNHANHFLRNRIRNQLLPLLKKDYQPGLAGNVLRLMEITGAESELAAEAARQWRQQSEFASRDGAGIRLSAGAGADFAGLPRAIQRKVLQQQLVELGVAADFDLIEQLRKSAEKFVSVGLDFSVARNAAGNINLRRTSPAKFNLAELKIKLSSRTGRVKFEGREFYWRVLAHKRLLPSQKPAKAGNVEKFDADRIGQEIILRHWRAGDRFQPSGLATPAKLQDLFVNARIPAARRRNLVLAATTTGEIFWVEELRIGERFKLTRETRRQWIWSRAKIDQI
jgi:tRNA(Ile)-lysidine synthase